MKYLTLDTLADHPKNVRAKTEYAESSITALAASIKALGLLQSLVVQQLEDGTYGVLAGRRRMMALRQLAADGDLDDDFKVPCKVIVKDTDHVTALSLAENTMQEPMAPIDEFEAFAAMIAEGETVDTIAATFGATVRAVKERLRYGLVHADIRAAMRGGTITLDVMKAYAGHPCEETQKRVFDGLVDLPYDRQAWRVRSILAEQDIRADDPLAVMVMDRYRERGGDRVEGLFEEDTVLTDRALAEAIRDEILMEEGEGLRAAHGLAWVEIRARLDYAELSVYGRIYPQAKELTEEGETRLGEIAERLDEIAGLLDNGADDATDHDALSAEYDALEEEADTLQNGYLPDHAARAGMVIAPDGHGGFRVETGLVRAEDYAAWQAEIAEAAEQDDVSGEDGADAGDAETSTPSQPPRIAAPSGAARIGAGSGGREDADQLSRDALSGALRQDLAIERAALIRAALSEEPDLARDLLTFRLATSVLQGQGTGAVPGIAIIVQVPWQKHSRPEAQDAGIAARIEAAREALDMSFLDATLSDGARFRAFRVLDEEMKAAIVATCVGSMVEPSLAGADPDREPFMDAVAAEAIPDIRSVWTPNAANYWSRVSNGHMLALLHSFGLAAETEEHRNAKKATLAAYMETLFAQPFATLTEEQREAVESWTPPGMDCVDAIGIDDEIEEAEAEADDGAASDLPVYSNLEPGERVVGANTDGETVIEDANGVRSVTQGGVVITEPVPVVPGGGSASPDPATRETEFPTVDEEAERRAAA